MMSEGDSAWEDLFADPGGLQPAERERAPEGRSISLDRYARMDGVFGAVLVMADGRILDHTLPRGADRAGMVVSSVGVAALELGQLIAAGAFQYGVATIGLEGEALMVLPEDTMFVGLLLTKDVSPAHIASKLGL